MDLCIERGFVFVMKMLILVILLVSFFPNMVGKARTVKCIIRDLHPPLHKYNKQGDLILGGVPTLSGLVPMSIDFRKQPRVRLTEEIL